MGGAARVVYDDTNTYVGIGTSTPLGEFSVDQLSSKGRTKPIFVVADNGTSSPFIFVSQKGVVSFGSSSPNAQLLNPGDVVIGRNGVTSDLYVSGGLGVGNATSRDGVLETSGIAFIGNILKVKGTGTSTITGGLYVNDIKTNHGACADELEFDSSGSIVCGSQDVTGDWTGTIDGNNFAGGQIGAGELIYGGAAGSFSELAAGTKGPVLMFGTGAIPKWQATSTLVWEGDTATSTITNAGLSVGGGGLASSHGLTLSGGTIESLSSGTSTFAGGLNISAGGINFALPSCTGSKGLTTDAGGVVVCSTITAAPAGSDSQVQYNNGGSMVGAAQLVYDDTNTYVGIGTSTPWGEFSVDQLSSKGITKPIFVVADNGTSSPFIFVSQKGVVSFGSSSPNAQLLNPGDVVIGRNGVTSDLYVSGGLGVGNATSRDGVLETSGIAFIGNILKVKGTGTSTITGGLYVNDIKMNLPSCTGELQTDAQGSIVCGSQDVTGDWTGTIDGNNFAGGQIGAGEMIYGGSAGSFSELAAGTRGQVLMFGTGAIPKWQATS